MGQDSIIPLNEDEQPRSILKPRDASDIAFVQFSFRGPVRFVRLFDEIMRKSQRTNRSTIIVQILGQALPKILEQIDRKKLIIMNDISVSL